MTAVLDRARAIFPPSGKQYELADCAIFVVIIVGIGYVLEEPGVNQQSALGFLEWATSLTTWGAVLTACAAIALGCSYSVNTVRAGYAILIGGCVLWCGAFLAGIAFFDGSARSIVSAVIYGWVVSRLVRVGRA